VTAQVGAGVGVGGDKDKRRNDFEKFLVEKRKLNKEFLLNAKRNQVEKCLDLMVSERGRVGADINCKDEEGWTAMHHTAWNGNLKF
jgi:ankyrin repeat protein